VTASRGIGTAEALRRGVLALGGLGLAGTTIELVFLRHWATLTALMVWIGIAVLAAGYAAVLWRPTPRTVRVVRTLAIVALVVSVTGVALHVIENLDAGPLDRAYAATWDTMSPLAQWWTAIAGGVGPAPVLAPGALSEIALALALGTVGLALAT
jgi:hypothetical protein